jgi:hypothetical protein
LRRFLICKKQKTPAVRLRFSVLFDAWQLYAGLSCPSPCGQPPAVQIRSRLSIRIILILTPPGPPQAAFKIVPDDFVPLRRALTDKQQIKQKAQSFD